MFDSHFFRIQISDAADNGMLQFIGFFSSHIILFSYYTLFLSFSYSLAPSPTVSLSLSVALFFICDVHKTRHKYSLNNKRINRATSYTSHTPYYTYNPIHSRVFRVLNTNTNKEETEKLPAKYAWHNGMNNFRKIATRFGFNLANEN